MLRLRSEHCGHRRGEQLRRRGTEYPYFAEDVHVHLVIFSSESRWGEPIRRRLGAPGGLGRDYRHLDPTVTGVNPRQLLFKDGLEYVITQAPTTGQQSQVLSNRLGLEEWVGSRAMGWVSSNGLGLEQWAWSRAMGWVWCGSRLSLWVGLVGAPHLPLARLE